MIDSRKDDLNKSDLLLSVFVAAFLAMLLSHNLSMYITEPIMRDQSVFTGSRYTITTDALNTIAEDDGISIVAMGSSMTYKGIDGKCIGKSLGSGITAYNLAQPSSKPYTDMQHIPRLISANPDVVLIEIAPDILSTPLGNKPYIELRYKLDSIYQDNSDLGDWIDIVPHEYRKHVAMSDLERMEFRQEYVPGAIEEQLSRLILDVDNGRDDGVWGWAPSPGDNYWHDYIQTPIFPNDSYGMEGFSQIRLDEYTETKLQVAPWPKPPSNGTLSHTALEYEINSLIAADIDVIITTPAYHPEHLQFLESGQWDGFNETLLRFSQYDDVLIFDQTWAADTWVHDDFYDRNHLDDEGREKYCGLLIPSIREILNR